MNFETEGTLVFKGEVSQKTESFKTREFVIEKLDDIGSKTISNFIKFQCVQDKTQIIDKFNVGESIKVHFNLKGTKWTKDNKVSYFTNLDAWRVEYANVMQSNKTEENFIDQPFIDASNNSPEGFDDLPF